MTEIDKRIDIRTITPQRCDLQTHSDVSVRAKRAEKTLTGLAPAKIKVDNIKILASKLEEIGMNPARAFLTAYRGINPEEAAIAEHAITTAHSTRPQEVYAENRNVSMFGEPVAVPVRIASHDTIVFRRK